MFRSRITYLANGIKAADDNLENPHNEKSHNQWGDFESLRQGSLLANKKFIPESPGTLRIDSWTFGIMTFAVIIVINALSFFPALALGPLAEYFSLY